MGEGREEWREDREEGDDMMVMVMGVCVLCLETGQWGSCRGRSTNSKFAMLTRHP
jgi:hypothetical protein